MAPISLCPAKTFRRRGSRVTRKCDHYCDQEFAATRKLFAFTRRLPDVTDRRCWRGSEIFRLKPSYLLQAWRHRMLEFWFSEHISQNLCLIFCGPQISYSVPRTILSGPPRFKFFGVFSFGSYSQIYIKVTCIYFYLSTCSNQTKARPAFSQVGESGQSSSDLGEYFKMETKGNGGQKSLFYT